MTITQLSQEKYERILAIQKEFPRLTFENRGYEYLSANVKQEHKDAINEIEEILDAHVEGFCEFNNFRINQDGDIVLRFQYLWDGVTYFKGVGYLKLLHLLNGFQYGEEVTYD